MSYTTDLIPNLQGVLQDKADIKAAVAAKGVIVPDAAKLGDLPALIGQIETGGGGVELPALDNPAAANDIASGKQAIDGNGNKLTGTYTPPNLTDLLPTLSNAATATDIISGKEAIDGNGNKLTGTYTPLTLTDLLPTLSNAASAADIVSGKQAINAAGEVVTGTGNFVVKEEKTVRVAKGSTASVAIKAIPQLIGIKAIANDTITYTGCLITPSINSFKYVDDVEVRLKSESKISLKNDSRNYPYSVTLYIYY